MSPSICFLDEEDALFTIPSYSEDDCHYVSYDADLGWGCTCEHYTFRRSWCKHMQKAYELAEEKGFSLNKDVFVSMEELD